MGLEMYNEVLLSCVTTQHSQIVLWYGNIPSFHCELFLSSNTRDLEMKKQILSHALPQLNQESFCDRMSCYQFPFPERNTKKVISIRKFCKQQA